MTEFDWQAKKLAALCPELAVGATHEALLHNINALFAPLNLSFEKVLERGGWHHLGGVVDIDMRPVASNLRLWAETESGKIFMVETKTADDEIGSIKNLVVTFVSFEVIGDVF